MRSTLGILQGGRGPARRLPSLPSGLTARRFVDFARTKSMMCHPAPY